MPLGLQTLTALLTQQAEIQSTWQCVSARADWWVWVYEILPPLLPGGQILCFNSCGNDCRSEDLSSPKSYLPVSPRAAGRAARVWSQKRSDFTVSHRRGGYSSLQDVWTHISCNTASSRWVWGLHKAVAVFQSSLRWFRQTANTGAESLLFSYFPSKLIMTSKVNQGCIFSLNISTTHSVCPVF